MLLEYSFQSKPSIIGSFQPREASYEHVAQEEEIDIDLNDPEVAKAALKIQSTFKGLKSRTFGPKKV